MSQSSRKGVKHMFSDQLANPRWWERRNILPGLGYSILCYLSLDISYIWKGKNWSPRLSRRDQQQENNLAGDGVHHTSTRLMAGLLKAKEWLQPTPQWDMQHNSAKLFFVKRHACSSLISSLFFLRNGCLSPEDARLSPRDELLTLKGQSLKDLSSKETESLIHPRTQLMNFMMSSKVSIKVVVPSHNGGVIWQRWLERDGEFVHQTSEEHGFALPDKTPDLLWSDAGDFQHSFFPR